MIDSGVPAIVEAIRNIPRDLDDPDKGMMFADRVYPVRAPESAKLLFPFVLWFREGGTLTETTGGGYSQPTMRINVFSDRWVEADQGIQEIVSALSREGLLFDEPSPPSDAFDPDLHNAFVCSISVGYRP